MHCSVQPVPRWWVGGTLGPVLGGKAVWGVPGSSPYYLRPLNNSVSHRYFIRNPILLLEWILFSIHWPKQVKEILSKKRVKYAVVTIMDSEGWCMGLNSAVSLICYLTLDQLLTFMCSSFLICKKKKMKKMMLLLLPISQGWCDEEITHAECFYLCLTPSNCS